MIRTLPKIHMTTWEVVSGLPEMDRVWCHCGKQVVRGKRSPDEWADAVEAFEAAHEMVAP